MWKSIITLLFCVHISMQGQALAPNQPLTTPLAANSFNQTISKDFLLNLDIDIFPEHLSSVSWLDDGHIVYDYNDTIEVMNIMNGSRLHLDKGNYPKASPDGQWIAFFHTHENERQIWIMRKDGTEKKQITDLIGGFKEYYNYHYNFAWSLDSRQIAFYVNPIKPCSLVNFPCYTLPKSTIHVVDVLTGFLKEVFSDFAILGGLSWFTNGENLLFSKVHIGFYYNDNESNSSIQSVRLNDGYVKTLAKFNGLQQHLKPNLSPDGLQISLLYNAENDLFNWMKSVGIVSSQKENEGIEQLTFDLKIHQAKWAKDGKSIYALRNYGAYNQIYKINAKTGELRQITNEPLNIRNFWLSPDGLKIIWLGMNAHGVSVLRMFTMEDCKDSVNLLCEPTGKENFALSEVREIEWETFNYPSKMRGLLFLPYDYEKGKRYPLVIDIHGGGGGANIFLAGGILLNSPLEWQWWTSKGYAVFVPEFRSSAAFGFLAISRDDLQEHDSINCDMIDILAGLDELVKLGIVDNDRVAAIGHSAGGRRANWITVASKRFKVIISKEGWADEILESLKYPELWKFYGGSPHEFPENYLKNSALYHSKGASTPTLFLMGNPELGGCDPGNTVYQLYEALKKQDVETEYIKYEDEGHCFKSFRNRRDALERATKWIDHYTN